MRITKRSAIRLILLVAVFCCVCCSSTADTWYVENEWNYLDTAMDPDNGIPEDAEGVLARIRRNGVLRVAADFECAPLNFLDPEAGENGQYAGLDMMLAHRIAEKMGVELVIVPLKPTQKLSALLGDRCDLTISAVTYSPERALYYTMSNGYYFPENEEPDIGILIRKGETITSLKDLENKRIVAKSKTLQEAFAAENEDLRKCEVFYRVASSRAVYEMVQNGEADAGIASIEIANTYFLNDPESELCLAEGLEFPLDERFRGYRVAAKKGETQLIAFVNGVIREAEENGDLEKWLEEAREHAEKSGL